MNRVFGKTIPVWSLFHSTAKRLVLLHRVNPVLEMPVKTDFASRDKFLATFNRITDEHLSVMDERLEAARRRYRTVFDYNCKSGKLNRGLAVVTSLQELVPECREESIELARIVGWCIEMLQAYFLVDDDIEDASETRRGNLCWYKVPGVGMQAINDSCYLRATVFQLLKRYLRSHPAKWEVMDLFLNHDFNTIVGQTLDMANVPFEQFSMDNVAIVYEFKTAYYSFSLPVRSAMYLAGISDANVHKQAESILLKIGHLFQAQDDYLDCYGDPDVTGKIGTDIQDSKCTWLVVTALQCCNEEQRKVLRQNYGKSGAAVQSVTTVYDQLDVKGKFLKYEEEEYHRLIEEIRNKCNARNKLQPKVFENFLNQIYKRQK